MGKRIAEFDWSNTSLGPIQNWPQSLKTAVNIMVNSPLLMVIRWGKDGVMLYNDKYAQFAAERHPGLLGTTIDKGWPEVAEFVNNFMEKAFQGESLSYINQSFLLNRNGQSEEVWFDVVYSPIMNDMGEPAGSMAIGTETTQRVLAERKQQKIEERFELAMNAAGMVGTWDWDIPNDCVYSDPRFAALYSLTTEQALQGISVSAYQASVHPDDIDDVKAAIQVAIQNQTRYSHEHRVITKDGSVRWIVGTGQCLYDEAGQPLRFPGVVVDITERKLAEEAMHESELKLRRMFESSIIGVVFAGPNGELKNANDNFLNMVGYTREDLESGRLSWKTITPPGYEAIDTQKWEELNKTGECTAFHKEYIHRDGHLIDVMIGAAMVKEKLCVAYVLDISEQKRTERKLQQSVAQLLSYSHQQAAMARFSLRAISGADDMAEIIRLAVKMVADMLDCGYSKVVQQVTGNTRAFRILSVLGYDESLIGQVVNETVVPHAAYTLKELKSVKVDDFSTETRFKPSGLHRKHQLTSGVSVVIFANGKPFGVLEAHSTQQRHFSEAEMSFLQTAATLIGTVIERKQTEEVLSAKNELLKEYAHRLEVSNHDLSQFAFIVSHDLQAPLRKMYMFGDFLKNREAPNLSKEGVEYVDRIQRSTERMQSLIMDLLALSRIDRAGEPFVSVDFKQVITTALDDLADYIKESNAQVQVFSDCQFEADKNQIVQLLINLIGNAIKYRFPDRPPVIQISCETLDARFIQIKVSDNGIGIKQEYFEKIFEIFKRLHNEASYSGTGIGLAIVKRIVDRHRGKINVESIPDEGSTFIVKLPIKQT